MHEQRTLTLHPMVAALILAVTIGIVWAGVALGGGSTGPMKATRSGDGPGTASIKARTAGATHHARAGGKAGGTCPGKARAGRGFDASAAI